MNEDDVHRRRTAQLLRRLEAMAEAGRRFADECDAAALALAEIVKGLPETPDRKEGGK